MTLKTWWDWYMSLPDRDQVARILVNRDDFYDLMQCSGWQTWEPTTNTAMFCGAVVEIGNVTLPEARYQ